MQSTSGTPTVQEFAIRVPKNGTKKYNIMRFNSTLNMEFPKWTQVKMERENNLREFKGHNEEQPKFGAGSEFGREAREEARRKKYGIITRRYKSEDQPWILKVGGKAGKKFKGIRDGGIGDNAAYYVFTHASDGAIEAFPLSEWYNFQPIARYKALSAEEAEQEYGRRNKALNYFSLMLRKRLRNGEEEIEEDEVKGKKKSSKASSDLKISEMDDWVDSDEEESSEEEEQTEEAKDKKEKKKKKQMEAAKKKKKKKHGSDDSAIEESDDGDEEGRELDYISDSSDSESDQESKANKELKGVAEESALRKLLASDDEDEEEEEEKEEKKSDNEEAPPNEENATPANSNKKKKKKKVKKEEAAVTIKNEGESTSDFSPDSSDSEADAKAKLAQQQLQSSSAGSNGASSSVAGSDLKRISSPIISSSEPSAKKPRLETPSAALSGSSESGITEEAVRRYLTRKPMTTTELLQKFRSRKTGLSSEQLVNIMTQILKRINPIKQTIKNKMYLFIKA